MVNGVEQVSYVVTSYADEGGSISPLGDTRVPANDTKMFSIRPNPGYVIDHIMVDGIDMGALSEYTFRNVIRDHTIAAYFRKAFEIRDVCVDAGTGELQVRLWNESNATLIGALYSETGQILSVASQRVQAKCEQTQMHLSLPGANGNYTVRVMLLQDDLAPLCTSYELPL